MSTSATIALIIATSFLGLFVFFYITKMANDLGAEILVGTMGGHPVSTKHRWLALYGTWTGYVMGAVVCSILGAAVNVVVATHVTDAGVKALAYLAALFGAVAALGLVLQGVTALGYYRSVLRQSEAD